VNALERLARGLALISPNTTPDALARSLASATEAVADVEARLFADDDMSGDEVAAWNERGAELFGEPEREE
jgi:hypothetical protein